MATTPKPKRRPGNPSIKPGPGRPKGLQNKVPGELKAMILEALGEAGGVQYLVKQAKRRNPAPFMALLGKVLPLQVKAEMEHTGGITVNIKQF